jgi:hypothetical protein
MQASRHMPPILFILALSTLHNGASITPAEVHTEDTSAEYLSAAGKAPLPAHMPPCHSKPWLARQLRVFHVADGIPAATLTNLKAIGGRLLAALYCNAAHQPCTACELHAPGQEHIFCALPSTGKDCLCMHEQCRLQPVRAPACERDDLRGEPSR